MLKAIYAAVFFLSSVAQANVLGEMQTFAPNTDGLDFITVHSARPLNDGYFAFSNYLNFAKDHLLVYENFPKQDRLPYSSQLFEYDFGISYAVTKTLQVSLMAPFLLDYYGETKNGTHVELTKGAHDYRPGVKWTFYQNQTSYAAGLFSVDIPTVTNSPYTGVQTQPIFNYEIAYTTKNNLSSHGYNLGYRKRLPTDTPADARMFPLHDQLIASYGYSRKISDNSRFVFELFSSLPLDKTPYDKASDASSLDALFAVKHFWWKYLRFDWGVTLAPPQQTLSPTWRAFAGLVYYWKNDLMENENPNSDLQPAIETTKVTAIQTKDFSVTPQSEEIYTRAGLQFEVDGDPTELYQFSIEKGPGSLSDAGFFRAPALPGKAQIKVTDRSGKARYAEVSFVVPPKADKVIQLFNLNFITGKDVLNADSQKYMDKDLATLKTVKITKVIVEGHTDSVGTAESNIILSQKRADFVRKVLIERFKLPAKSVITIPYGESTPIASNATAKGRKRNRRVELKVYL